MKLISVASFLILVVALLVGKRRCQPSNKWHEGNEWENLLSIYDSIAERQYRDCDARLIPTSFGKTQVFCCGSPDEHPPVVLFHGIATNSLMFGDWLVPKLSQSHYSVAVDTLCDMGRSLPTNGDISNCPQTEEQVAEWASQVFAQANITKKVSLVGFSFGSFLASCVAMKLPELVDKQILIAPAGVVSDISLAWVARAMTFGILSSIFGRESVVRERLSNWFFGYMTTLDPSKIFQNPELRKATDKAGSAQVGVRPVMYSVESLREMNEKTPTLLIIGDQETVIDANVAIDACQEAGIKVKVYPGAGHMLFAEYPKEEVVEDVVSFLE